MTGCSLAAFLVRAPGTFCFSSFDEKLEGYVLLSAGDEEAVLVRRDLQEKLGAEPKRSIWRPFLDRGKAPSPWVI